MSIAIIERNSVQDANCKNSIHFIELIRSADPAAATRMYSMYAAQIRAYLRRHSNLVDVEDAVFAVLVEAIRAVRDVGIDSLDELSRTVREFSQQTVFALRRIANEKKPAGRAAAGSDAGRDLVNGILSCLDARDREILLRSLVLLEGDDEISNDLNILVMQIRKVHSNARVLFRVSNHEEIAASA